MKEGAAMRGCFIVGLLAAIEFFLVLFKIAGVGDVKTWSWPTVLIPLWIWCGLFAIFLVRLAIALFGEVRRQTKSSDGPEGRIEEFFRKRRAKKHERDQKKWGVTK